MLFCVVCGTQTPQSKINTKKRRDSGALQSACPLQDTPGTPKSLLRNIIPPSPELYLQGEPSPVPRSSLCTLCPTGYIHKFQLSHRSACASQSPLTPSRFRTRDLQSHFRVNLSFFSLAFTLGPPYTPGCVCFTCDKFVFL